MVKCDEVASLLDWWQLAGPDTLVEEVPRSWLRSIDPAPLSSPTPQPMLPASIDMLDRWIADPANLSSLGDNRVGSFGDAAAPLMIFVDTPDVNDGPNLLSGEAGRLFDRILAAIGLDRSSVHVAPLCPARPSAGKIPQPVLAELLQISLQRIAIARPKMLLLFGDATVRAFLGMNLAEARGQLLTVNYDGGSVTAVATFHPRFLLKQTARKADCWRDLQRLIGVLEE